MWLDHLLSREINGQRAIHPKVEIDEVIEYESNLIMEI